MRPYIWHLVELHIPVEPVRGRYGGYRLARHLRLPPLMLTDRARADVDALVDYRQKAPGVTIAHPTVEHFVPLLLSVGAATDVADAVSAISRMVMGNSIRSIQMD